MRDRTGSDTETAAALGHSGLAYVGRYARRSNEEREATLEQLLARSLGWHTKPRNVENQAAGSTNSTCSLLPSATAALLNE